MSNAKIRFSLVLMVMLVSGLFLFYEVLGRQPDLDKALAIMTFNVGTFNAKTPDMIRVGELISKGTQRGRVYTFDKSARNAKKEPIHQLSKQTQRTEVTQQTPKTQ